jgi:hypothetical protein
MEYLPKLPLSVLGMAISGMTTPIDVQTLSSSFSSKHEITLDPFSGFRGQ